MRRTVMVLILIAVSAHAHAQIAVDVQLNAQGQQLAQQLGITQAELASRMQNAINVAYGATNVDGFIRSFADATAFSMRGLGVDYASDPNSLILGIGANFAVAASEDVSASDRPTAGLAANIAFMAGLNLASQGAPRWTVFANGFYRNAATDDLRGGLLSGGLHVQYRLIDPQRDRGAVTTALRWGGVDITGGIELTRWTLGIDDDISTDFGVTGTSGSANLTLDSTGTFDLRASTVSIPVEVSTSIRIALLLSVYIGAAVDITAGTGKLDTNLDGTLTTSDNRDVGTATITGGGQEDASPLAGRILAGAQLNLWKLRLYLQLNGSTTPAANVGFGVRGVL
jgi:hypothetical protein